MLDEIQSCGACDSFIDVAMSLYVDEIKAKLVAGDILFKRQYSPIKC